jgi:hypothetical protein
MRERFSGLLVFWVGGGVEWDRYIGGTAVDRMLVDVCQLETLLKEACRRSEVFHSTNLPRNALNEPGSCIIDTEF